MAMPKATIGRLDKLDYRANEAFKRLRTNLQYCGDSTKVIAITSCVPNDGKSTVSFNLAASFAEMGKKVLYIDADLRKSVFVGKYKVDKADSGLTHYLSGMKNLVDIVYSTNIENLYMIFAGPVPPDPAELLAGNKFDELIGALRSVYDYVIIDTPPLGSVIDSAIIAGKCDGAALVVSVNEVSYRFAQDVVEQLKQTGTKFLGVILNKVNMSGKAKDSYYGKYYGKYYGNYYRNYGQENEGRRK